MLAKNLDITAIQVLSSEELNPNLNEISRLGESESAREISVSFSNDMLTEYKTLLKNHCVSLKEFLHQRRISFLSVTTEESLEQIFFEKFQKSGLFNA